MEQESKRKNKTPNPNGMFLRVLFGFCLPQTPLSGSEMLRGQRGTAGRTKASWAEAAKSSNPVSEVGSLHLETVREV